MKSSIGLTSLWPSGGEGWRLQLESDDCSLNPQSRCRFPERQFLPVQQRQKTEGRADRAAVFTSMKYIYWITLEIKLQKGKDKRPTQLQCSRSDLRENSAAPTLEFGAGVQLPLGSSDLPKAAKAATVAPSHLRCPPPAGGLLREHRGAAQGVRSEGSALLPDGRGWKGVSTVGQPAGRKTVRSQRRYKDIDVS